MGGGEMSHVNVSDMSDNMAYSAMQHDMHATREQLGLPGFR